MRLGKGYAHGKQGQGQQRLLNVEILSGACSINVWRGLSTQMLTSMLHT
jgi:hypothetical protein